MAHRPALTIGIDARAAGEPIVGRGRVVQELLAALSERSDPHRYILYSRAKWDAPLDDRFEWRIIGRKDPWWHLATARAANRECEVFLSSNSYLTVWFMSIPTVPIVYDMVAFDRAAHPRRQSAIIEWLTIRPAVRKSAAFVAISQATADEFAARFPSVKQRTVVAPLAAASFPPTSTTSANGDLPDAGFVLAVGTLEPRKNLPRLIDAFRRLPSELQQRHPLVVVGKVGWQAGTTMEALKSLGDRCLVLGAVSDTDLAELYRRCAVFCYPSLAEGFGLPVLEAMTCGAAVVTSNCSSLPEVGGNAVEYVDPREPSTIAHALERLLLDPEWRGDLSARAKERARGFSWARTAEITLGVLEEAARRQASTSERRKLA
jgi:glycosyltransferase involved in cell wall biosynthesis